MFGSDNILAVSVDAKFVVVHSEYYDKYLYTKKIMRSKRSGTTKDAIYYASDPSMGLEYKSYCSSGYFVAVDTDTLIQECPEWFSGLVDTFERMQRDIPDSRITDSAFLKLAKLVWSKRLTIVSKNKEAHAMIDKRENKRAVDSLFNTDIE